MFGSLVAEGVHRAKWIINVLVLKLVPAERAQSSLLPHLSQSFVSRSPARCEAAGGVEHLYLTTHADDGIVLSSLFTLLVFGSLILNISGYHQRLTTQVHVDLAKLSRLVRLGSLLNYSFPPLSSRMRMSRSLSAFLCSSPIARKASVAFKYSSSLRFSISFPTSA